MVSLREVRVLQAIYQDFNHQSQNLNEEKNNQHKWDFKSFVGRVCCIHNLDTQVLSFHVIELVIRGQLCEAWLPLTICLEVLKPMRFYGS